MISEQRKRRENLTQVFKDEEKKQAWRSEPAVVPAGGL